MKYLILTLFFLPVRSPDLNPIEDLWRMIKDKVYKTYYDNLNDLIKIFKSGFEDYVGSKSLYENWIDDIMEYKV